jgi:uncharacterized protein (TIGR04255 family)
MPMFQTPDDQRYIMDRPPLVRAVVELSFPFSAHLARALSDEGLVDLQSKLSEQYPLLDRLSAPAGAVVTAGSDVDAKRTRYVFGSPEGYELVISPSNATLSIDDRYSVRDNFQAKLLPTAQLIGEFGEIKLLQRLGVRYINAGVASLDDWGAWFKPEFTGWINADFVRNNERRVSLQIAQLSSGGEDPKTATVRYGYLSGGVGPDITKKDPKDKPSFLADIDVASETSMPFNATEIAARFRELNYEIARFFVHSLTDEGKKHFGLRVKEDAV